MSVKFEFNIGYIRITNIDSSSAVNFGQSMQQDWHSISKSNTGYGKVLGDGVKFERTRALIQDPDGVDMLAAEELRYRGRIQGPKFA